MAHIYEQGYLEYTAPDGRHWRIWPDGAHIVVPRLEDVQTGTLAQIAARDLAAEFFKQQQSLAEAQEKLDQSEDTVASLRLSLWETLHTLEEARALLEEAAAMCGDERWTTVNAGSFSVLAEEIRAFLARQEEPTDGK